MVLHKTRIQKTFTGIISKYADQARSYVYTVKLSHGVNTKKVEHS